MLQVKDEKEEEEKKRSKIENSPINVEAAHSQHFLKSSKIGENLNSISDTEINQNSVKQSENKNIKLNKQKKKEKKKDAKTGQLFKKLNVSSIELTCSKVCHILVLLQCHWATLQTRLQSWEIPILREV